MSFAYLELLTMKNYQEEQNVQALQESSGEEKMKTYMRKTAESAKESLLNWKIFAPDNSYIERKSWCYI